MPSSGTRSVTRGSRSNDAGGDDSDAATMSDAVAARGLITPSSL